MRSSASAGARDDLSAAWLRPGPAFGEETVLRSDLDLDRIAEAKYDFDVVGHYARPDVFTLSVDERFRPPVVDLGA